MANTFKNATIIFQEGKQAEGSFTVKFGNRCDNRIMRS